MKIVGGCINETGIRELRIQIVLGSSDKGRQPVVGVVIPDPLSIGTTNRRIIKIVIGRNSRSGRCSNRVPDQYLEVPSTMMPMGKTWALPVP